VGFVLQAQEGEWGVYSPKTGGEGGVLENTLEPNATTLSRNEPGRATRELEEGSGRNGKSE
jgi:hypothetical protein